MPDTYVLYNALKEAYDAISAIYKTFKAVGYSFDLQPFYLQYSYAEHEDAMRFLNILQAGRIIEIKHHFSVYKTIPWQNLSEVELFVFKHYCAYMLNSDRFVTFDKGNPPDISRHILYLERKYECNILK
ncbi:hypothetical protein [Beggiatoa leptomitoformis]|uniref:Uncharacterized protein n=1 Tax=Beggiatoa leptomitoformis TaxID=288004 RepID=A0A2N9YDF4_9GAMM|nr:hypothetical protein [Beggiatoa leptomitoformis]ALG69072.1 hypothetical protein AL038_17000 [Beggiatoa leptomitoformis]AUI68517.1 hypothetical protein BLE401_07235 [Beggiatoa leptomitoformis]